MLRASLRPVVALIRDGKSVRPTALEKAYTPYPDPADPSLRLHRCASNFEAETTAAKTGRQQQPSGAHGGYGGGRMAASGRFGGSSKHSLVPWGT